MLTKATFSHVTTQKNRDTKN